MAVATSLVNPSAAPSARRDRPPRAGGEYRTSRARRRRAARAAACADDLALARACMRGDERAWERFARTYFGFIRGFARRFLDPMQAGELADQVIADLWQRSKLARYEGRSTLRTWLGAVVGHAALNAARRDTRLRPLDAKAGGPDEGWISEAAAAADGTREDARRVAALVGEAVATLPPEARLLLLMYYEQGLTLDEMAVALRSSKATLSRRLSRTRDAVRAALEALAGRRGAFTVEDIRGGLDAAGRELDLAAVLQPGWQG